MPATFTCQVLSPYQAGLNITKLVSSRAHDSRQPGAVDAAREFPLPLCIRVLTRNMSSSFHFRHRMWHPQPPAFVTHTKNKQGYIVLLQMWGEVLAADLIGGKPLCKSLCWSRWWDPYALIQKAKNAPKRAEDLPPPSNTGLALAKKALSPLQSARAVTWIRGERHKSGPWTSSYFCSRNALDKPPRRTLTSQKQVMEYEGRLFN